MKYIVCGIGPGTGGVGKFLEYLISISSDDECEFIYPKRSSVKNNLLRKIIENAIYRPIFRMKLRSAKGHSVTILHQQTVGYSSVKWLVNNASSITLYVMDNGVFCVKAYNYIDGEAGECFKCLGGDYSNSYINKCIPQPLRRRSQAIAMQKFLEDRKCEINFITLSESNAQLLMEHYGKDISISTRYFQTLDLINTTLLAEPNSETKFDVVLHAGDIAAKGFIYFLDLASLLPEFSFFVPTKKLPFKYSKFPNIHSQDVRWENGLKQIVENSRLILTPSLWSFTPEAATLKSLTYNGAVAVVKNKYSFSNEMSENAYLPLSGQPMDDAPKIKAYLDGTYLVDLREHAATYTEKYFYRADRDTLSIVST